MPTTVVNTPDGRLIDVNHPEGADESAIISYAAQQFSLDPSIAYMPGESTATDTTADVFAGEVAPEDETTLLGSIGEFGKRAVGGLGTGFARVGTGLAELLPGIDDESARQVQRDIDDFVARKLEYDPAYDENYGAQLGQVVGEMVPMIGSFFLPGGLPARAAQLATMIGPAVSEGGMDRAEYEQRTGEELSDAERLASKGADIVLGRLEQFGLPTRVLKGLPKGFFQGPDGNKFLQRIESMIISGGAEGIQEVGQGIARDLSTLAIYDEDRRIGDSALDDFTLGGGAGAIFDLVIGSVASRGRRAKPPSEMEELSEEEVAEEQERREERRVGQEEQRRTMDKTVAAGSGERFVGPSVPEEVRVDPFDTTAIDPTGDLETISAEIVRRAGSRLPIGAEFQVKTSGRKAYVEQAGEQFGPSFDDPLIAQELSNRLTATSQQLRKDAEVDYIVENAGLDYNEQQLAEAKQIGRAIPSTSDKVISIEDANLATGRDIGAVINKSRVKNGQAESNFVSIDEIKSANKGDIGAIGDVIATKDADFLAFRDDPQVAQAPVSPTQPRQPALGRRQQALSAFSSSFVNPLSTRRAFVDLLANKRMDVDVDSNEFRGLIKRIIGKTPPKKDPLSSLSANERRYLYHRVRRLPSFQLQATKIPDYSTKTPDADLVRIARRQVEVDVDPAARLAETAPSKAEARRAAREARRTAREPIERAEAGVEAGKELTVYDIEQSGPAQQLRDMLKRFGISDEYATRMVEKVGTARRDSDGNVYILPRDPRDMKKGEQVFGAAQEGARVIQVGLDGVKKRVEEGATYEEAVARAMNHEIVHALRQMDLFTREEYSLLERLTRKYEKPGEGMTYGQWATVNYPEINAVRQQEEAIAEMISDALTDGVIINDKVTKPSGKPASIFKKIVDFFKGLVGVAQDNDAGSFRDLVDQIQTGQVGRRERDVVRTARERDYEAGEIRERGITTADLATRTGDREPYALSEVVERVKREAPRGQQGQALGDAPTYVDEAMLSRRIERAADQGFNVNTTYYHGTATDPLIDGGRGIRRFQGKLGMGVVAGHFTENAKFASNFAPQVMTYQPEYPVVYPVFLRYGEDNEVGGLFEVRSAIQDEDNLVSRSINRTLNNQPELKDNLESYFANELEKGRQFGPDRTKLRGFEQADIARFYYEGAMPLQEASERLAEDFHNRVAPQTYRMIVEDPYGIDFTQLEPLAPYMKEAGFVGYYDIERPGDPYSAVAMFNSEDIKGVFAEFDPESVPEGRRYEDDIVFSKRLEGMPETFDVDGQAVEFGYHQPAVDAARRYAEKTGIRYEPLTEYAPIDERMAKKIAIEYDEMQDAPDDPEVKAAYDAMIDETLAQYEEILNSGLTVQFIKGDDPYGNPRNAILDVINNNHMYVFSTRDGYGMDGITQEDLASTPMLRETKYKTADGDPMLANDVFRVVHDYFGHIKNGVGFRARGEENAWQSHAAMYSPLARRAMTSETRGQNSWVNFGPSASFNATANGADTVYADQKTGLLPLWVSEEARQSDPRRADARVFQEGLEGAIGEDGKLKISHFGRQRITRTDPEMAGRGADRTRRYTPKGTYFGIVEADENGYRREAILGNVEHKFSVDPLLVYPLDKDPYDLVAVQPAGNLDWDTTLKALNDNGFIGFRIDDKQIGKVAFINQPLIPDEVVDQAPREKPQTKDIQTKKIAPRQSIDPEKAEQVVADNLEVIKDNPTFVPRFSVKASPDAQYIAQNPNAAQYSDDPIFSKQKDSAAVEKLTRGPDREAPNGKVFMNATGIGSFGTMMTKLKQGALDRYAPLAKYYQKIPGLRELEAESSAIAAALFSDRSKGILASAVKYGVPVYRDGLTRVEEFTHEGKTYRGLIGVMSLIYNKDVGDLRKIAQAYAMVQRGQYLDKRGKPNPVDAKTRKEILAEVDALTDSNGYNPVKEWHKVWNAYNDRTIDFLKATGILDEESADLWRDSSYVPFYRTDESDAVPKNAKGVFGDLTRMAEFKAYQGSEKAVDVGLVESIVMNLNAAIDMGMKNVAQQRIARDMQSLGLARQIPLKSKSPNGVKFKINGQPVQFAIDDNLIHDAMMTLPAGEVVSMATKYLGMPANALRELVTRDPGFMVANMLRDTLSTWTTSGASFVPIVDTVKGVTDGIERLEKMGVVGGYDFSIDRVDIVDFYEKENRRRDIAGKPLNMFTRLWDAAGMATTGSDAATRNAVYNDVLARTGNEAEAAFQAMEIINFSRRGANPYVRLLTASIPFLNARFQGLDVFARAMTGNYTTRRDEPPAKGIMRFAVRGSIMMGITAMYYALASGNDWYEEQSEEVRELNWLIPTPWGVPFKMPIPFEVGLLFKTIPEAILANQMGNQSDRELRETLQRGVVSTLEVNPFGIQAISPLVEAGLNHSFYTSRPVVPVYMSQITPGLQTTVNTPEILSDVGEALNVSPMKLDHVARGYGGTLGSYLISLIDAIYREGKTAVSPSEGFAGERPERTIFEFPLWRRFFGRKEGSGLRSDVYDVYNDIQEVVRTINDLNDSGRGKELDAYIASRAHILALKDPVYNIKREMDAIRARKEQVIAADLDPAEKTAIIEELDADLNEKLMVAVPLIKQARDAPAFQPTY